MTELTNIGAQMANVLFNLAQLPGERITYQQAEAFDKLRKDWDAARRATLSSECALPPGERIAIMTGESCYTAEQVEQIRREAVEAISHELWCAEVNLDGANEHLAEVQTELAGLREAVEADREQQKARIQHLTHERDRARLDSQTWHRLVMALGIVFGFDTSGSAAEIGDAASAARANFAAIAGQLARQSQGDITVPRTTAEAIAAWDRMPVAAPPLSIEPQAEKGSGE